MQKKTIILLLLVILFTTLKCQEWSYEFNGIDSLYNNYGGFALIYDLYSYDDDELYIGGAFAKANSFDVNSIVKWNGDTINSFSLGVYGTVFTISIYQDTLYVGGDFPHASNQPNTANLAVWNGTNWQTAPIGKPGGAVYDFCVFRDTLYISGNFSTISYVNYDKIAAYSNGIKINIGDMGMWTRALAVLNGDLYAGGYYGLRRHISGTEWETLPVQTNGDVRDMITDTINSFLYVGGFFTEIEGVASYGNAMWDGFNWNTMGDYCTMSPMYQALAVYRGDLYVSGRHIGEGEDIRLSIDRWDGEQWDSIGGSFNESILSLEVFRDTLIIGGAFTLSNDIPVYGLAKLYMPDNGCDYLKPRINTWADTFYLEGGEVDVNLYNNNPYADSWEWDFGTSQTGNERNPVHTYTQVGEYNVQVTVTDGECVKTANKTIYIELGSELQEFEQIEMQIFPNPSSKDFTLIVNLPDYKNAEIKIAGLNGHLKSDIPVTGETTEIVTKGWSAGTYICNLFIEEKLIKTEKLVFE
ncbi:MAG: PKD domain-containing protein [Bacteroidales bacterium]|nr:PKD domain-containing protein [Bacteroidales bacterium]